MEEALYPSFYMSQSDSSSSSSSLSLEWTRAENKAFESALALYGEHDPHRWLKVAALIPGKSVSDVVKQYRELEEDVCQIEAGRVPIPGYFEFMDSDRKRPLGSTKTADQGRKKGVPWTEDEHRRFLKGLMKYGKGDWRNISRNFVASKTPTQVASHAQKYFIRQQLAGVKEKRRPSIHDITTFNLSSSATAADAKRPSPGVDLQLSGLLSSSDELAWNHHHSRRLNADLFVMGSSGYEQSLYAAAAVPAFQFSGGRRIRS